MLVKEKDVKTVIKNLKHYLQSVFDEQVKIHLLSKLSELPFFLMDAYEFYEITLLDQVCVLMVAKEGTELTPATIRKYWEQVNKKWPGLCIYVQQSISAYNRARLIKHRVPFIVPGNQMYLPDLGIDLREHFRKQQGRNREFFSPATQAAMIYVLMQELELTFIPSKLAQHLKYTLMTMTRAFNEWEAAGIGEIHRQGKERYWSFKGSKKALWEQVKPMMRSPVKNRFWLIQTIPIKKSKIIAGLSALSHYSMLNSPSLPIYAISSATWRHLKLKNKILPSPEEAVMELEIWHYDPGLFEKESYVDPFSLYLSLKETNDARVDRALEEMMEKIK